VAWRRPLFFLFSFLSFVSFLKDPIPVKLTPVELSPRHVVRALIRTAYIQITMPTTPFQTEAWAEYGLGTLIVLLRIFARWKVVGFKWQGDDWFSLGVLIFWTVREIAELRNRRNDLWLTIYQAELTMLELIGSCNSGTFKDPRLVLIQLSKVKMALILASTTRSVVRLARSSLRNSSSAPSVSSPAGPAM